MHPMVNIALGAARKAGEIIARAADRLDMIEVGRKSGNDFVTEIDRAAEREIISQLRKAYPEHLILAEESGASGDVARAGGYQWIIDPLDGTTNFMRGIPHFAVSPACATDASSTPWSSTRCGARNSPPPAARVPSATGGASASARVPG